MICIVSPLSSPCNFLCIFWRGILEILLHMFSMIFTHGLEVPMSCKGHITSVALGKRPSRTSIRGNDTVLLLSYLQQIITAFLINGVWNLEWPFSSLFLSSLFVVLFSYSISHHPRPVVAFLLFSNLLDLSQSPLRTS
jgi:hypothetical protein